MAAISNKPVGRILISNDDGVDSIGITILREIATALSDDIWIIAGRLRRGRLCVQGQEDGARAARRARAAPCDRAAPVSRDAPLAALAPAAAATHRPVLLDE